MSNTGKNHSENLIEFAARLRDHALDTLQTGVTLSNPARELVYVNDAFVRLSGYSREELMGKNPSELLQGAGTDPATAELLRGALNQGQPFYGDILNYRKDGTPFWNQLSITPVFDDQGVLVNYFSVQRDITAQKESALALQKSQEQLKLVLQGSGDGLWDWDVASDTIERSARWYEMLGYEPQSLPAFRASWAQTVHPDDRARVDAEMDRLLASKQDRYSMELRLKHQDGHYLTVLSRGYVQRDDKGRAVRLLGTTTNATKKKAKEAKLSLAEAVFQQSREGIIMTDANGNIIMVNKAFTGITGYTEAEVQGKNPRMFASGRHGKAFYQGMWNDINSKDYWAGEVWDRRKDGTVAYRAQQDCRLLDAERVVLGVNHALVGLGLARHWKFPEPMQQAVACHHAPLLQDMPPLSRVALAADVIGHALDLSLDPDNLVPTIPAGLWQQLGLDEKALHKVFERAEQQFEAASLVLSA